MHNKYTKIPNSNDPRIPERLRDMVTYLNKLVAIDRTAISVLLDRTTVPVNERDVERLAPDVILRPRTTETGFLCGLGILAGFVNTGGYRLFAEFEGDAENPGYITGFGVFRVSLDGDPREVLKTRVRTWPDETGEEGLSNEEKNARRSNHVGVVEAFLRNESRLRYEVRHDDGTVGSYLPTELQFLE